MAAPSAPSPRPTRPNPAYGRHGTRARAWRCWGLAQAAYKWLKAVGLGAGACCVHCVVLAPSATPLPNPTPNHSRPSSQCTWTPSLLVARAFRANFDTDSTAGPTTRATRAGGSGGVTGSEHSIPHVAAAVVGLCMHGDNARGCILRLFAFRRKRK